MSGSSCSRNKEGNSCILNSHCSLSSVKQFSLSSCSKSLSWVASESCSSFRDSYSIACNSSVSCCIIAAVTFALLWSLLLKFEEGPAGVTTPDVDVLHHFSLLYQVAYYPFLFQPISCLVLLDQLSELEDLHLLYYWLQQQVVVLYHWAQ